MSAPTFLASALMTALLSTGAGTPHASPDKADAIQPISLIALLADPERFDGRNVATYGYLMIENEVFGLCPQPVMSFLHDCLRIHLDSDSAGKIRLPHENTVHVQGQFSKPIHEHDFYGGRIRITQIKAVTEIGAP